MLKILSRRQLALVAALACVGCATQTPSKSVQGGEPSQTFKSIDTDGNGQLSQQELQSLDTNGDNGISPEEWNNLMIPGDESLE
jgi:hypothetical protein